MAIWCRLPWVGLLWHLLLLSWLQGIELWQHLLNMFTPPPSQSCWLEFCGLKRLRVQREPPPQEYGWLSGHEIVAVQLWKNIRSRGNLLCQSLSSVHKTHVSLPLWSSQAQQWCHTWRHFLATVRRCVVASWEEETRLTNKYIALKISSSQS